MVNRVEREKPGMLMGVMQRLMAKMTPSHVRLYRLLRGRWVDKSMAAPVVVLTTTGRRSGESRSVVVGHLRDGEDILIAATNGGLPSLPAWVLNLRADPECRVLVGSREYAAHATVLEGEEWAEEWIRFVTAYEAYDQAHRWSGRPVPVVRLTPSQD